jgi:hypothetical protein
MNAKSVVGLKETKDTQTIQSTPKNYPENIIETTSSTTLLKDT